MVSDAVSDEASKSSAIKLVIWRGHWKQRYSPVGSFNNEDNNCAA